MSDDFEEENAEEQVEEQSQEETEEEVEERGGSLSGKGGGVYSLLFPKGKDVRYAFSALSTILKSASLRVGPEGGVKMKAIDDAKISLILLEIPASSLDEVNIGEDAEVGISFDVLKKIMKRIGSRDKVELIIDKQQAKLSVVIYTKKGGREGGVCTASSAFPLWTSRRRRCRSPTWPIPLG